MMLEYMPLEAFKAIYVVDLCASLCEQVRLCVEHCLTTDLTLGSEPDVVCIADADLSKFGTVQDVGSGKH